MIRRVRPEERERLLEIEREAGRAFAYERLGFRILDPADHGAELAALVREEAERIPGDAPRVAMRREVVVTGL